MSHGQATFMSQTIGERLRKVRGDLGVGEFAERLGVNRKTVTRWEANEALPDGASLLSLHQHFGVDPGWLLTGGPSSAEGAGSTAPPQLNSRERALLANYRGSDEEGRRAVESTASALAHRDSAKKDRKGGQ